MDNRTETAGTPQTPQAAFRQILAVSAVFVGASIGAVMGGLGTTDIGSVWNWAAGSGRTLVDQSGWAFTVYFTALLAFFVALVLEQKSQDAHRTRRLLARTAIFIAAFTVPPLLIVIAFCTQHAEEWTALFLLAPTTVIIWLFAAFVGSYNGFTDDERRAQALETQAWARGRLGQLPDRPSHTAWVVVPANSAVAAVLVAFVALLTGTTPPHAIATLILAFLVILVLLATTTHAVYTAKASASRSDKILTALAPVAMMIVGLAIAAEGFPKNPEDSLSGVLATLLPLALTFLPAHPWTVRGAATRHARRDVEKAEKKASAELVELGPETPPSAPPTMRQRLIAAIQHVLANQPL